jgi:hypothetical protein
MGGVIGKIDEHGKPAWIALIVLSFIVFHPLGLVMLLFVLGSGRMGRFGWCGRHRAGRWYYNNEERRDDGAARWSPPWRTSSGNSAFDEYRTETLKRLEDEQREFKEFLDRLRHAKDKAEFDQFMADRARRPQAPPAPETPPQA